MSKTNYDYIQFANYKDIPNWSVQYVVEEQLGFTKKYPMAKIGSFLKRSKNLVEKAAQLAKIKEYHTTDYPGKVSWIDNLTDKIAGGNYLEDQMKTTLGEYYWHYNPF